MTARKPIMYANLHNHSTHSDGVYDPYEITKVAMDEGYGAMALTDHDTVTGNADLEAACKGVGMQSIYGCEFMTKSEKLGGLGFHLTAFDFDAEMPEMKEYLRRCSVTMTERTKACFKIGQDEGLLTKEITWQEVLDDNNGISWICNDHVFRTMKKKGLAEDKDYPPFLENIFFKYWKSVPDTYEKLDIEPLVALIRRAGGLVIVAHPYDRLEHMPYLTSIGIEGLEVWHPSVKKAEIPVALRIARDNKLYISGGPDHDGLCGGQYKFYDDYKSCPYYISELSAGTTREFFDEIKQRRFLSGREELISEYAAYHDEFLN